MESSVEKEWSRFCFYKESSTKMQIKKMMANILLLQGIKCQDANKRMNKILLL